MKLLWCLFLTGVISVSADLGHFKADELSDSFKSFEITIPEGCDSTINSCIAEQHAEAKSCVEYWKTHCGKHFEDCNEDSNMAEMSKTWQEASFHWHKAVDSCLQGKEPPTEAASSAMFLLFLKRRKRSSPSAVEHHHDAHDNCGVNECFKHVQDKAAVCNAKVMECAPLAKCWGVGDAPSAEAANDVTWFEHIKELREKTQSSIAEYKAKIAECLGQKRVDDMKAMLKDFDMSGLSSQFRHFNLSSSTCNPEIWECIESLHQRARMCVGLQQKENEKSDKHAECTANDDIKQARSDWEKASGKWHQALDLCMAGEAVPEEQVAEVIFFFLRRKRSTEEEAPGPAHPHRHAPHLRGHGPRVFANAAECWKDVASHRRDCSMKAKECNDYAVCSGMEGTEVPEDKKAWFDRSKQLRERQQQTMEAYEKKLHDCLGTPVPARAMEMEAEKKMNEEATW